MWKVNFLQNLLCFYFYEFFVKHYVLIFFFQKSFIIFSFYNESLMIEQENCLTTSSFCNGLSSENVYAIVKF